MDNQNKHTKQKPVQTAQTNAQLQNTSASVSQQANSLGPQLKCSILCIGTELTTGQILNRNTHWLAEKTYEFGIKPDVHMSVPDDRELILQALTFCANQSEIMFITGGLGPTSDDFTREVVAEWAHKKLIWSESAWQHIQQTLQSRGVTVKEIQKQQCYFPQDAEILTNQVGTAHGFALEIDNKKIFVLPGPPREIANIWQNHIHAWLEQKCQNTEATVTRSWDTIGLPESEVAEAIESCLEKFKTQANFEIGYRVHLPFVEVKLSFAKSQLEPAKAWLQAIETAIGPKTVLRDGADAARELVELIAHKLRPQNLYLQDASLGGFTWHRLYPFLHSRLSQARELNAQNRSSVATPTTMQDQNWSPHSWGFFASAANPTELHPNNTLHLSLNPMGDGLAKASLSYMQQKRETWIQAPYRSQGLKEREAQYWTEMAFIFWLQQLYDLCYNVPK